MDDYNEWMRKNIKKEMMAYIKDLNCFLYTNRAVDADEADKKMTDLINRIMATHFVNEAILQTFFKQDETLLRAFMQTDPDNFIGPLVKALKKQMTSRNH